MGEVKRLANGGKTLTPALSQRERGQTDFSRASISSRRSPGQEGDSVVTVMSEEATLQVEKTREDAASLPRLAASPTRQEEISRFASP